MRKKFIDFFEDANLISTFLIQGDGISCADIDECSDPNLNACSKDPPVQCINIIGSYMCEACPAGFLFTGHSLTNIRTAKSYNSLFNLNFRVCSLDNYNAAVL